MDDDSALLLRNKGVEKREDSEDENTSTIRVTGATTIRICHGKGSPASSQSEQSGPVSDKLDLEVLAEKVPSNNVDEPYPATHVKTSPCLALAFTSNSRTDKEEKKTVLRDLLISKLEEAVIVQCELGKVTVDDTDWLDDEEFLIDV